MKNVMNGFFKIIFPISLFLLFCLFIAVGNISPDPVIKLGLLRIEDNLPFFIAEQEGFFEREGVQVELITFNSARERDMALEAGEINGVLSDILSASFFKKGGTPVKIVSLGLGATPQEGRFVILSSPHSGITTPEQLKNIPVAISMNTIIHYLAEEMLEESGLQKEYIKVQNIPDLQVRYESLIGGKSVKAALLPDPLATLAEKEGANIIVDDTRLPSNLSQTVILFNEDILKEQPQKIRGIMKAYERGADALNTSQEKYKSLIVDKARIPHPLESSYKIPVYPPLQLPTKDMIIRVTGWMAEHKLLDYAYSFEELVAPGFM